MLIESEQDPLALFFAEAMRSVVMAALAVFNAIIVIREVVPPAQQGRMPYAKQVGQLVGSGTTFVAFIKDQQSLLAIVRRRQSTPSSPQKG